MRTIKTLIALWFMFMAMKLVIRKDARALRTCIPLTLAMLNEMEATAPERMATFTKAFRDTLAKMRAKLAELEGQSGALAGQ